MRSGASIHCRTARTVLPSASTRWNSLVNQIRGAGRLIASAALSAVLVTTLSPMVANADDSTVTFAGGKADYIFPLYPLAHWDGNNTNQFQNLMWRPLYWYGTKGTPALNTEKSIAFPPTYSDNNRTVTIKLKPYKWSDGVPVTSRDVEFWMNLLKANKAGYGPYVPGTFPDNVKSVSYPNPKTVVMHLNRTYNASWFTNDPLSMITPIPQHVWDKTSTNGKVSNFDRTTTGARAVYAYLNKQSDDLGTYASNPLWKVVDGPWTLQQFTTEGKATFVPNAKYSGSDKPKVSEFVELPFTTDEAEFNAVRAGTVDYGYLPFSDVPQIPELKQMGYSVDPWPLWGVNYLYLDYGSTKLGPIFSQLYIRQALQHLINQPQIIKSVYNNYAYPTYGPVPVEPANSYASSSEKKDPYPYDPKIAIQILKSHGWKVAPNGLTKCSIPQKCGSGIAADTALSFSSYYPAGNSDIEAMMEAIQSSFRAAGVDMSVNAAPTPSIGGMLGPSCKGSSCWGMIEYGTAFYFQPAAFPDGGSPFGTGALAATGYKDSTMDKLIQAVRTSKGSAALDKYEAYAAHQLPGLWIPMFDTRLSVVKSDLKGTTPQNVIGTNIAPEDWSFSS